METIKEAAAYVGNTVGGFVTGAVWSKKTMRNLKGWTILVMGASDGVGYEAAKAFAEHGAHVIVHGRDQEKTSKWVCCSQKPFHCLSA